MNHPIYNYQSNNQIIQIVIFHEANG